jgi:hypothetical protein
MPIAELTIYEKCGNMPMIEHVQRFNESVSEFCCALSSSRQTKP